MLLEVALALAMLIAFAGVTMAMMGQASGATRGSQQRLIAVDLARSAIAKMEAGIETAETLNGPVPMWVDEELGENAGDARGESGWELAVETQPSEFAGLTLVLVTARTTARDRDDRPLVSCTLKQLVRLSSGGEDEVGDVDELQKAIDREKRQVPAGERRRRESAPGSGGNRSSRPRRRRRQRGHGLALTAPNGRKVTFGQAVARTSRGFTLVEVMAAVALVVLLIGALGSMAWTAVRQRENLRKAGDHLGSGTLLIERLEDDLLGGLAGDGKIGAGIEGNATRVKVLSRGVWLAGQGSAVGEERDGESSESLMSHAPSAREDAGTSPAGGGGGESAGGGGGVDEDLQGCEIRFDRKSGIVSAKRWAGASGGSDEVVAEGVARLRLRYFDGRSWSSSFDSAAAGGLPVAIEIAVWFGTPPPVEQEEVLATEEEGGDRADRDVSEKRNEDEPAEEPRLEEKEPPRLGPPDRLRVITVPDGPVSAWKEAR